MYYDLDLFGKEIVRIRKRLNFTQRTLADLTNLNIDTLSKIENGKVIPNHITLEVISSVLNTDLNQLLLNYRFNKYISANDLITRIDLKLEKGEFSKLKEELPILKDIIKNNRNKHIKNKLNQYYLFIEAIICKKEDNNFSLCLIKLIESIKLTIPHFALNHFDKFEYNSIELRILMNIALVINILVSENEGLKILKFCLEQLDNEQIELKIKLKILFNLANSCYKLNLEQESLQYFNSGIETCIFNNILYV